MTVASETGIGPVQARLRVLVVDDVDANCRLAQALLRGFGHSSEVATSGLEAVEMTTAGRYDVILMDMQMPDIDGMEATRRIHERLGVRPHDVELGTEEITAHEHLANADGFGSGAENTELKNKGWRAGHSGHVYIQRRMLRRDFSRAPLQHLAKLPHALLPQQ